MTQPEVAQLLGFGSAGQLFAPASYEALGNAGVTFGTAVQWMQFYAQEALVNPSNPSAAARAGQLSDIVANWP
jgi:hypothetical protein